MHPSLGDGGRSVCFIFNPASGRGRARRIQFYREQAQAKLPSARQALTTRAGEEGDLAERALDDGCTTIVACGGDGTWSQVADRLVGKAGVRFGILPSGTGNDFGRSLGIPHDSPERAFAVLLAGKTLQSDVGRVLTPCARADLTSARPSGPKHFLNLVGFGFDIAVIDAAKQARFLRGPLLYKITALQQLFRFPGIQVTVDGGPDARVEDRLLMLTISNGRYFGGGFPIAPNATVTDHALHACCIRDASPGERLKLFNLAERGRHVGNPRVALHSLPRFEARFSQPPRFEIDGDVYLASAPEVQVEVVPEALEVLVP
jgi:diacylglycerol kinase (ATP)